MDTKKLVVGQDVFLINGPYIDKGKVVKVTPSGVDVQTDTELVRFDKDGKELDASRRDRLNLESSGPGDRFYNMLWNVAPEFQPWELDDMPFAERTAELKQVT